VPHSPSSYLSDKCEVRAALGDQKGVYAVEAIPSGDVVAVFGGVLYLGERIADVPGDVAHLGLQIEEDIYLVPTEAGPAHRLNHSCDPNCGFDGQVVVVTMRPVAAGEQLFFDYAMCDGTPYDEFTCRCGSERCRGEITGDDWRLPELHRRYEGYFSPYLRRRIEASRHAD
jgi:hypothetical protein